MDAARREALRVLAELLEAGLDEPHLVLVVVDRERRAVPEALGFTPTPVISHTIRHRKAIGGINMTASHNPAEYQGLKFSTYNGAPATTDVTKPVEAIIRRLAESGWSFKDLHRVFEYHGAEHKTIACYEAGLPLTVENIRRQSRFHPRCGTSFMILVIIISIFLYAVLPWTSTGMRIVYKLCMFPLLVGISYEILKWAGRSDSVLSKIVSQPGLWMQRLTTFEPDDSMIEVAIAAVTPVLPEKQEEARW